MKCPNCEADMEGARVSFNGVTLSEIWWCERCNHREVRKPEEKTDGKMA